VLFAPLVLWLILNEVVYSNTSEVVGPETLALIWHNPAAVFEAAWEMGAWQLIMTAIITIAAVTVIYCLSLKSYNRTNRPHQQADRPRIHPGKRHIRLVGSITGYMAILAGLLVWQFTSEPSEALTVVFRSAPPLRAFNLTRALVGIELTGPAPEHFGLPVISDEQYQATMGSPRTPAPNIIFIMLESVSAKALHCYGYHRSDITPNIDTLADEGVLFEHCLSPASFSSYCIVSLMTSLYMLRDQTNDHFADKSFPFMGMPRTLKLAGYELALFSSGNESFDKINHFYPPSDFDTYFSHDTCDIPKSDCMRMDDKYAVGAFEKWLSQRNDPRPFYCSFYLQSTHFNYQVPEPWFSYYQPVPPLYSNGDGIIHIPADVLPLLKNQYDNAMRYADYWIGRIRDSLAQASKLDNSIIVITSDHGEAFMEHGLARHGVHVWEEMIHVPLIVYVGPALRQALPHQLPSRVPDTVSGIDIAPTVAALVGFKPHPSWQGVNVLAPGYTDKDRPIFSILQLTRWQELVCLNKYKYIYDLTDVQSLLFDLNTDPDEKINLVEKEPQLASTLQSILGTWHTRQLAYYSNQPFTNYIGKYESNTE
ncbi:MAG: sulfatase, partial [Planctomycetota bacterium]